jgi:hypothetical protein
MTHLALVTGGARRLGRAIALRLANEGCDVALHYRSSAAEAEQTAQDIRDLGRQADLSAFDLADERAITEAFSAIEATFGRAPDVLVNSASLFEWDDLGTTSTASLKRHFETNLYGPVILTRLMAARGSAATRGLIINLLDQKLFNPNRDHLAYTLSKYALQGFTTLMARELAPRFRVCAIAPGLTLPGPGSAGERFDELHDETPLGRGARAEDIAEAAAFLLRSPAVTGQTLIVDGGSHMVASERDFAFR